MNVDWQQQEEIVSHGVYVRKRKCFEGAKRQNHDQYGTDSQTLQFSLLHTVSTEFLVSWHAQKIGFDTSAKTMLALYIRCVGKKRYYSINAAIVSPAIVVHIVWYLFHNHINTISNGVMYLADKKVCCFGYGVSFFPFKIVTKGFRGSFFAKPHIQSYTSEMACRCYEEYSCLF